jgi:D-glycero-D-manno-heptose 1,7-bisphosphate phosphatase
MGNKKAVFFDRDGTLIVDKVYLNDPDQIEYLPGVFEALRLLRDRGFSFAIVTNQSGVARGLVSISNLEEIHRRMTERFALEGIAFVGIYYAPHAADSNHEMRKPNPGMLQTAAIEHGIDLSQSWIVGDRMSDVEAGTRAGCRSVLLTGEDDPSFSKFEPPTATVSTLQEMAKAILDHDHGTPKKL